MSKPFLVTLQPLSSFYFGSERNFQGGQSYYARSLRFPQQTTLLGVLRYKLLDAYGLITADNYGKTITDMRSLDLIGPRSFSAEDCSTPKNYGVIKGLSHLFLMHGNEIFYPGNLDYQYTFARVEKPAGTISITDRKRPFIPTLTGYDPKNPEPEQLTSNTGARIELDKIFAEAAQVGILKTKRWFGSRRATSIGEPERGFYKQVCYQFRDRAWQFAFLAHMDEAAALTLMEFTKGVGRLTHIGGERSPFNFTIGEPSPELISAFTSSAFYSTSATGTLTKAVLLSDTYMEQSLYEFCDFAVSDVNDFRFLRTTIEGTKNYHKLSEDESAVRKSGKLSLLQRGSVLYISENKLEGFKKAMEQPQAFRQIGFNSYLTVNSSVHLHSWIME